jgi:hypothetical protein
VRSVRPRASEPTGLALFFATMLAITTVAAAQQPAQLEGDRESREEASAPLPGPRGRPFVVALIAAPLMTYVSPAGLRGSEIVTLGERFATTQLVGAGYVAKVF